MRIIRPVSYSPAERQQREWTRWRHGSYAPPKYLAGSPVPFNAVQRQAPPQARRTQRLMAPGPVFLPEVDALDLVAQRRAARTAAPLTPPPTPTPAIEPDPQPESFLPRPLLGW